MYNLVDLTGKKIVVTGASKGIGRGIAIMLSKLGAQLILVARGIDGLEQTKGMLEGNGHSCYSIDLGDLEAIEGNVKNIVENEGPIDGLVYSAGLGSNRPLQQFKPEYVDKIMKVNFYGFIETLRCFTKKRRFNEGMRAVVISSVASIKGSKSQSIYSASKGALNAAVRSLAIELADKNICLNAVLPGMIHTDMYDAYLSHYGKDSESNTELLKRQYLGIGSTEDVAAAVSFLISPASRFITGQCIPVDGGSTSC